MSAHLIWLSRLALAPLKEDDKLGPFRFLSTEEQKENVLTFKESVSKSSLQSDESSSTPSLSTSSKISSTSPLPTTQIEYISTSSELDYPPTPPSITPSVHSISSHLTSHKMLTTTRNKKGSLSTSEPSSGLSKDPTNYKVKDGSQRLIWLLVPSKKKQDLRSSFKVRAKLQTYQKKQWSKGRSIALKTLVEEQREEKPWFFLSLFFY